MAQTTRGSTGLRPGTKHKLCSSEGKGFPNRSVISPVKALQLGSALLRWKLLQLGSTNGMFAQRKLLQLCSDKSVRAPLWRKCHTAQQTSYKRFTGRKKSRRRVTSAWVRSSSELNTMQGLYKVSFGECFPGWPGIGGFSWPARKANVGIGGILCSDLEACSWIGGILCLGTGVVLWSDSETRPGIGGISSPWPWAKGQVRGRVFFPWPFLPYNNPMTFLLIT